ncbi:hypothetical protein QC764_401055 [Podospora pseudoanserina]|uniref:Uncharacterized protein n=1 Tax=Podospora pseudoanserina TaxID=2609844 RepID=A0ABR0I8K7_9PEZI|nr:hypothetical protein QC764_401055 [Podospora pseudoanserina]
MSHNDDRVEAFTKTFESAIEAAISKQFTDSSWQTEIQRLEEKFQQEKSRFLTIAKAAAGGKISQDKLEVLADGLLKKERRESSLGAVSKAKEEEEEEEVVVVVVPLVLRFRPRPRGPKVMAKRSRTQPEFDPAAGGSSKRARVGFAAEHAGHAFGDESPALAGAGRAVRKRVEIKNRDVSDWESEGQDDIFEDLEFGTG